MNYLNLVCPMKFGENNFFDEVLKNVPQSHSLFLISRSQHQLEVKLKNHYPDAIFISHSGEPTILDVNKILSIPQILDIESIVAIGGGSVLDLSKCLALAIDLNLINATSTLDKIFEHKRCRVKLVLAPTTSGTGSEMSLGAIITTESGKKTGVRGLGVSADLAIIDTSLMESMPKHVAQDTAFDVLSHAVESYFSKKSNTIVKLNSENIIRFILNNKRELFIGERSKETITKLAYFSSLAGINLASSSTCLPHRIQYVVAQYCHLSHARSLMLIYPTWLKIVTTQLSDTKILEDKLEIKCLFDEIKEIFDMISIEENLSVILRDVAIEDLLQSISGNLGDDPVYTQEVLKEIFIRLKGEQ
jgi:alcohol dehydrogenase class IV